MITWRCHDCGYRKWRIHGDVEGKVVLEGRDASVCQLTDQVVHKLESSQTQS